MNVEAFVRNHLTSQSERVLEVGCGRGELATALAQRGHSVTAIDPEAPEGAIFTRTSLEEFGEKGLFDAVIANSSLHHVHDLAAGLDKIHSLLRPAGVLILNEFAWDRMDDRTARWYLSKRSEPRPNDPSLLPGNFPRAWIEEHRDLHDSHKMLRLLDDRFNRESFEWVPYISEHYLERPDLLAEEEDLGQHGEISLIGFRYVARRR